MARVKAVLSLVVQFPQVIVGSNAILVSQLLQVQGDRLDLALLINLFFRYLDLLFQLLLICGLKFEGLLFARISFMLHLL